ncbi:hypothetical protein GLAREA_05256 [Glarea lozoyensis ATCC 20868]|uniref:Uncharacterized protein n=1 Tax=Glarea lozoyensis (strain ATCC 20868 / MF5171) TaxID=1116229 RepID=S3EC84_GLAL2|nr:uncharacterized protein GLAREA_05256 [Glarea lozoyensis ATCC 20868]EPE35918.1 hypothetical protein GLAREA_05256 [Glarea lozoyensis ATCC 20868]
MKFFHFNIFVFSISALLISKASAQSTGVPNGGFLSTRSNGISSTTTVPVISTTFEIVSTAKATTTTSRSNLTAVTVPTETTGAPPPGAYLNPGTTSRAAAVGNYEAPAKAGFVLGAVNVFLFGIGILGVF